MNGESPVQAVPQSAWFKSSYSSGAGGECIEVAGRPGRVYVRDSKDATGPMLSLAHAGWAAFVEFAAGD
ncbi:DUF397 domain-containing protein [Streptomyces sp. RKND-216]|uniref:DUF397 domain-containing protein n=1 Tax=Streptomyces sp. RKND-216 TaxID=2562581 RepID=UPI00109DF547|nr:DUF397 domain-containing protein [Streptomyces sp. RKND-216]THA26991.1 DUF397 domain-containing protein [Streptomyces sp. RKND-216]